MSYRGEKAREQVRTAAALIEERFDTKGAISAQYIRTSGDAIVAGVSGLGFESPFISVLLQIPELGQMLTETFSEGKSILFAAERFCRRTE